MSVEFPRSEQPGLSVLAALFQHNAWANLKLLEACAGLSEEQLAATAVGTYGPIRATLLHLVRAETRYVEHGSGKLPPHPLRMDSFPSFEILSEDVRWTGAELLQLALSARADTMVTQRNPTTTDQYKLADLMIQAVSHSTEHRTQVSAILTQLGLEPPDLSGWHWMEEKGELTVTEHPVSE